MAIITIGGNVGAGKTTLAVRLANALGYEELYVGGIMREMAAERGMSIEDFYATLKNDSALERSVDERSKNMMSTKDNLVVQGRMAWYFAKESPFTVFNIFLAVDQATGARRTAERPENSERKLEELVQANALRTQHELERYSRLYGIKNFLDPKHYDYILDTSHLSEDDVLATILHKLKERLESDV